MNPDEYFELITGIDEIPELSDIVDLPNGGKGMVTEINYDGSDKVKVGAVRNFVSYAQDWSHLEDIIQNIPVSELKGIPMTLTSADIYDFDYRSPAEVFFDDFKTMPKDLQEKIRALMRLGSGVS